MKSEELENKTTQELLAVLRASLFTGEDLRVSDWETLFEEMKEQTVAALPAKWLPSHLEAPRWLAHCSLQQGQWVRVMHAQDQLLQLLEEAHIPCVILKGAAAAMAYPYPSLRFMGDVDFLVKRCDMDRTAALLERRGYVLTKEKQSDIHHYSYSKGNIAFELHKRLSIISESDEMRMAYFEAGIDEREWCETEGHRFPVFPAALNGLVLIFHISQHIREGLGLRQIIDWMMYVHTLPSDQWEALQPLLEETGQMLLAKTVTLLCQRYLGLRHVVEEDESLPVEDLLAYILEQGNFGWKLEKVDRKIATFALFSTEKSALFRRLQTRGMCNWQAAKRHAVLRPFAWIYQVFRILGELMKNKKGPKDILKQSKYGTERRQLIDALGLKVDRTIQQH